MNHPRSRGGETPKALQVMVFLGAFLAIFAGVLLIIATTTIHQEHAESLRSLAYLLLGMIGMGIPIITITYWRFGQIGYVISAGIMIAILWYLMLTIP